MTWDGPKAALLTAAILTSTVAIAADDPRFCPTRPNLGGSSCTTEVGRIHLEVSALDWQRDDQAGSRDDRVVAGDVLARLGVGKDTEVQLGFTSFGHDRSRDKVTGQIDTVSGVGDVTFAVRQHLAGHQGVAFSAGVQAFVTAPTGRYPIGAGTWSIGLIVPLQYKLTSKTAVSFTAETDAAANQSGDGRHFAYGGIGGLSYKLTKSVSTFAEVAVRRDNDPAGHETRVLAALSTAWRPTKKLQFDVLCVAGLNHASPDVRLVTGGAILF